MRPDRALDRFDGDMARRNCSPRSRDSYSRTLSCLFAQLPVDPTVTDVTEDVIRRCLDGWSGGKAGTRYKVDAIFRAFSKWLYQCELVDRNPMDRIPRPKRMHPDELQVTSVTDADVRRIFDACETWNELLCLSTLAYLGQRRRAAANLRRRDLDIERSRLRFTEKGAKVIWKPLPAEFAQLLQAAIAAGAIGEAPEAHVIPMARDQRRAGERDDRVIWRTIKRLGERAGVEVTPHALRAAFAVLFLEMHPGELEALQRLIGHSKIETTQIYLRRMDREKAMERVTDLSWGSPFPSFAVKATSGFEPLYEALQASA